MVKSYSIKFGNVWHIVSREEFRQYVKRGYTGRVTYIKI